VLKDTELHIGSIELKPKENTRFHQSLKKNRWLKHQKLENYEYDHHTIRPEVQRNEFLIW